MTTFRPNPPTGWRVESITDQLVLAPGGQTMEVKVIAFTTAKGVYGTVSVPAAGFTPDTARAAIAGAAANLDAVMDLSG